MLKYSPDWILSSMGAAVYHSWDNEWRVAVGKRSRSQDHHLAKLWWQQNDVGAALAYRWWMMELGDRLIEAVHLRRRVSSILWQWWFLRWWWGWKAWSQVTTATSVHKKTYVSIVWYPTYLSTVTTASTLVASPHTEKNGSCKRTYRTLRTINTKHNHRESLVK